MTNVITVNVKLGMTISSYKYDDVNKRLFVAGPAMEEGTWTGLNRRSVFYPRTVIHDSSHLFEGRDLVCEHLGVKIGSVIKVENTELGFNITEAYLTNPASINAVLTGNKRGFSIEALVYVDPIRNIALRIAEARNISLVATPACKVCGITNIHTEQGTVAIMSENTNTNTDTNTTEVPITDASEIEPVTEPVTAIETVTEMSTEEISSEENTTTAVFTELSLAAEAFKTARAKLDNILIGTDTSTNAIEEAATLSSPTVESADVTETVTANAEPESVGVPSIDVREIEISLSEAAETVTSVTNQLVSLTSSVQELKVSLGQSIAETAEYKARVEALEGELRNAETIKRSGLESEIKALDPDTGDEFITGMTMTQLSAYKNNLERIISKSTFNSEKKSVKRDEPSVTALSAATEPKTNTVDLSNDEERKQYIMQTLNK